jgi:hypothetical protein
MESHRSAFCCCFEWLWRKVRRRTLRQLHPQESRNTVDRDVEANTFPSKDEPMISSKIPNEISAEDEGSAANESQRLTKTFELKTQELEVKVMAFAPASAPLSKRRLASCTSFFNSAAVEHPSILHRDVSPVPLDLSVREIEGVSFSINSEPAFLTNVNSFEKDQMAIFVNQSSERASMIAVKSKLDEAFEPKLRQPLSSKFKQLPVDLFEYANKSNILQPLPAQEEPCQVFNIPQVRGRLRLKPITPEQFMRRPLIPRAIKEGRTNILDDLKKELEAEECVLDSPSPLN